MPIASRQRSPNRSGKLSRSEALIELRDCASVQGAWPMAINVTFMAP
jgi:hypothetical protein